MPKLLVRDADKYIAERMNFKVGGISASTHSYLGSVGDLNEKWRAVFDEQRGRMVYTVWSYDTPIAWVLDDREVVMPPVRYSQTTSEHQYSAARGLGLKSWHGGTEPRHTGRGHTPYTPRYGW